MKSKKFLVILVLVAVAAVVGVYDNFIRKPQAYIEPSVIIEHDHTVTQK